MRFVKEKWEKTMNFLATGERLERIYSMYEGERGSHETNAKRTILKVMRNFEKFVGDLSTANVALS